MELEIQALIGTDKAALFFRAFLGCVIYVPEHLDNTHSLVLCVGLDAAKKLSRRFSGTTISVPTHHRARLAERNMLIIHDRNSGLSLNSLAVKYNLTSRQIATICKQQKLK
jgi:hypothetical protein